MTTREPDDFGFGVKPDYAAPVRGISPEALGERMRASIGAVQRLWPSDTLVTVFVADFGEGGGLAYISNGERASMIATIREWLHKQEPLA